MTITPARDALYDALITGTQHAQIREHLVDAALEEDRATHAAGLGSTAEDEAALASLRRMATTRPGCVPSRAEVAEQVRVVDVSQRHVDDLLAAYHHAAAHRDDTTGAWPGATWKGAPLRPIEQHPEWALSERANEHALPEDQAALASARAEAWDLRRAMLSECDLLERETAGLNPAVVAERRLAAARIRVVIDDLLPAVAALVEAAGPADTNEEA